MLQIYIKAWFVYSALLPRFGFRYLCLQNVREHLQLFCCFFCCKLQKT